MTSTADLLTILHDIDRLRGKVCGSCNHYQRRGSCLRGHRPLGSDDGCDDWTPIPESPTVTSRYWHFLK